ncbi:MAG: DciA family protein [Propionibacterium sp.]|nr:DciA family protein [Propionibacterium sp.]
MRSDPDDPDARPESDPYASDDADERVALDHDPEGLDLAALIANQTRNSPLPPPRGVTRRPRARPRPVTSDWSGPGPDQRDPQLVGDLFDRLVSERGWSTQLTARALLERWPDLVGEVNASHSRVEAFEDRIVTVRCDSTTWAMSLRSLAPQLVAELNRRLGDGSVTRVVVVGPQAPSWKHGRRSVRDGRGPRDTYG